MTKITRSIEIIASMNRVWSHIQPASWPMIFNFVKEVDGYTEGDDGVGVTATFETPSPAGVGIKYKVRITEFVEKRRIAYDRYDGPLKGRGLIQVRSLQTGTLLRRTSFYDDPLSEDTVRVLSEGMEQDNLRLKHLIETLKTN